MPHNFLLRPPRPRSPGGARTDMRPFSAAVRSWASTRPSFSRFKAGCESNSRLGMAESRPGSPVDRWSMPSNCRLACSVARARRKSPSISATVRRKVLSPEAASCMPRNSPRSLPSCFSIFASRAVVAARSVWARWTVLLSSSIMLWALASRMSWKRTCNWSADGAVQEAGPHPVRVAHLQVEDLGGAELDALGRHERHEAAAGLSTARAEGRALWPRRRPRGRPDGAPPPARPGSWPAPAGSLRRS